MAKRGGENSVIAGITMTPEGKEQLQRIYKMTRKSDLFPFTQSRFSIWTTAEDIQ